MQKPLTRADAAKTSAEEFLSDYSNFWPATASWSVDWPSRSVVEAPPMVLLPNTIESVFVDDGKAAQTEQLCDHVFGWRRFNTDGRFSVVLVRTSTWNGMECYLFILTKQKRLFESHFKSVVTSFAPSAVKNFLLPELCRTIEKNEMRPTVMNKFSEVRHYSAIPDDCDFDVGISVLSNGKKIETVGI